MNIWLSKALSAGCVVTLHSTTKTTPSCLSRSWKPTMSLTHRTGTTYQTQVSLCLHPVLPSSAASLTNFFSPPCGTYGPHSHQCLWRHLPGMNVFGNVCLSLCMWGLGFSQHHSNVQSLAGKTACVCWKHVRDSGAVFVSVDGDKVAFMCCQVRLCVSKINQTDGAQKKWQSSKPELDRSCQTAAFCWFLLFLTKEPHKSSFGIS